MSTQWRIGMSGATGLDYTALPPVLRLCGIARQQHASVFADLQTLEDAALATMRKAKK
jgi:hypothetical protein